MCSCTSGYPTKHSFGVTLSTIFGLNPSPQSTVLVETSWTKNLVTCFFLTCWTKAIRPVGLYPSCIIYDHYHNFVASWGRNYLRTGSTRTPPTGGPQKCSCCWLEGGTCWQGGNPNCGPKMLESPLYRCWFHFLGSRFNVLSSK